MRPVRVPPGGLGTAPTGAGKYADVHRHLRLAGGPAPAPGAPSCAGGLRPGTALAGGLPRSRERCRAGGGHRRGQHPGPRGGHGLLRAAGPAGQPGAGAAGLCAGRSPGHGRGASARPLLCLRGRRRRVSGRRWRQLSGPLPEGQAGPQDRAPARLRRRPRARLRGGGCRRLAAAAGAASGGVQPRHPDGAAGAHRRPGGGAQAGRHLGVGGQGAVPVGRGAQAQDARQGLVHDCRGALAVSALQRARVRPARCLP